jgi:hypothetical protein
MENTTYSKNKHEYIILKNMQGGNQKIIISNRLKELRSARTNNEKYFLVLSPKSYNTVTKLDENSKEIINNSFFFSHHDKAVTDYGKWFIVKNNKYKEGDTIKQDLITSLLNDSYSLFDEFTVLRYHNIMQIKPNYISANLKASFHQTQPYSDYIKRLLNNKENLDVFFSHFSSNSIYPDDDLVYPFDAIRYINETDVRNIKNMFVGFVGPNAIHKKIKTKYIKFPENITDVFWYKVGSLNYDPWYALLKIKYKKDHLYGFFRAQCCHGGFDDCAVIELYLATKIEYIWKYAMDERILNDIKLYLMNKYKRI